MLDKSSAGTTRLAGGALVGALAILVPSLPAKEPSRFQHRARLPGTPVEAVEAVAQDAFGFLWFGSEDALYRWDGFDSKVYRHDADDPRSPSASAANDLLVDHTGTLWIATPGGGLNRFLEDEERFEHFRHDPEDPRSLSDDNVFCLFEDRAGALWIGTENGLDRFDRDEERFTRLFVEGPGAEENLEVYALFEDRSGDLWIGTQRGLLRHTPEGILTRHRHVPGDPRSLSNDRVHAIRETGDGHLWSHCIRTWR